MYHMLLSFEIPMCVCQSLMHILPNCVGEQKRLRREVRKGRVKWSDGESWLSS